MKRIKKSAEPAGCQWESGRKRKDGEALEDPIIRNVIYS